MVRQYCGTPGRIANCHMGSFPAYAGPWGHTLPGRELYLPEGWTGDPAHLQVVGLIFDTPFATKLQLVRARDAGVPMAWVMGDMVHDHSRELRS